MLRVCVAEDDAMSRKLLATILEQLGFAVEAYSDGQAAWDAFEKNPTSIMVTDWLMPRMDGLEATQQIRLLPNGKAVPIIALTANAFTEDKASCIEAGMTDFLAKPVAPKALFDMILKWLSR